MTRLSTPRSAIPFLTAGAMLFATLAAAEGPAATATAAAVKETTIEGGLCANGRYELRGIPGAAQPANAFVRLVDTQTGAELGRIPLAQPRLPDPDAPPCRAVWQPGGERFAFLDHSHRFSTRLSVYALFNGRLVSLPVPDYLQNALGRVDATEAQLPCWSRVDLWNGDDLPVLLTFNTADPAGRWVAHNAFVNLRLSPRKNRPPELKLQQVTIVERAQPAHPARPGRSPR